MTPITLDAFRRRVARLATPLMLAAALPLASGCYGRFPLTHAVYRLNGDVGHKVVQTLVFWVFVIIPVYSICMFVDAIVFNLIEFWTGERLISKTIEQPDGTRLELVAAPDGQSGTLRLSRDEKILAEHRLVRVAPDRCELRDMQDRLVGTMQRTPAGDLRLGDGKGNLLQTITAAELAARGPVASAL